MNILCCGCDARAEITTDAAGRHDCSVLTIQNARLFREINVTTSQVTNVSSSSYVDVKDPQPIPPGEYRLYGTETSDNEIFWLYRLETQTGRTWYYSDNSWTEIK